MEEKKPLNIEEMEEIAGGAAADDYFHFRMDVYRNNEMIDWVPCLGRNMLPARSLRTCIMHQNHVSLESIHIYLPSGAELNYAGTFEDNGICEGTLLTVMIEE